MFLRAQWSTGESLAGMSWARGLDRLAEKKAENDQVGEAP